MRVITILGVCLATCGDFRINEQGGITSNKLLKGQNTRTKIVDVVVHVTL